MHHQVPTCPLQLPQCALKFSVAVALVLVPLVDFVRQTVPVMRTAIEGEIAVKIYKQHAHEVRAAAPIFYKNGHTALYHKHQIHVN